MRDAITVLDQCADFSTDLCLANASQIIGDLSYETMFNLTCALINKNEAGTLEILENYINAGTNLKTFIDQYLSFCLDLAKFCLFKTTSITSIPQYLENRCAGFSNIPNAVDYANDLVEKMLELKNLIKYDTTINMTIEAYLIKMLRG